MKPSPRFLQRLRYLAAFLTVRPRRWFFGNCIFKGSWTHVEPIRWFPVRNDEWDEWDEADGREPAVLRNIQWPNFHWVFAYRTVFRFFKWLGNDAWRPLCTWTPLAQNRAQRVRTRFPWYARLIRWVGETTAGQAIHESECWHCAAADCDQCELAHDEDGVTFILEDQWTSATMDGTDYRFRGTTICPKCGYRAEYEDGSL